VARGESSARGEGRKEAELIEGMERWRRG